ncbi:hypothetical protein AGMMS50233_08420 [Endomicrobiia bacterium]|nr:hypothetical protein AGMMS50233_08420 [Endomicrobiia bacterium]
MKRSLLVFCSFFALSIFAPAVAQAMNVPDRSGIRVHQGSKPDHSTGCVLVPDRSDEDKIKESIPKDKTKK